MMYNNNIFFTIQVKNLKQCHLIIKLSLFNRVVKPLDFIKTFNAAL